MTVDDRMLLGALGVSVWALAYYKVHKPFFVEANRQKFTRYLGLAIGFLFTLITFLIGLNDFAFHAKTFNSSTLVGFKFLCEQNKLKKGTWNPKLTASSDSDSVFYSIVFDATSSVLDPDPVESGPFRQVLLDNISSKLDGLEQAVNSRVPGKWGGLDSVSYRELVLINVLHSISQCNAIENKWVNIYCYCGDSETGPLCRTSLAGSNGWIEMNSSIKGEAFFDITVEFLVHMASVRKKSKKVDSDFNSIYSHVYKRASLVKSENKPLIILSDFIHENQRDYLDLKQSIANMFSSGISQMSSLIFEFDAAKTKPHLPLKQHLSLIDACGTNQTPYYIVPKDFFDNGPGMLNRLMNNVVSVIGSTETKYFSPHNYSIDWERIVNSDSESFITLHQHNDDQRIVILEDLSVFPSNAKADVVVEFGSLSPDKAGFKACFPLEEVEALSDSAFIALSMAVELFIAFITLLLLYYIFLAFAFDPTTKSFTHSGNTPNDKRRRNKLRFRNSKHTILLLFIVLGCFLGYFIWNCVMDLLLSLGFYDVHFPVLVALFIFFVVPFNHYEEVFRNLFIDSK